MTDDLVKRLRSRAETLRMSLDSYVSGEVDEAADRIEELQDTIAKIQYTNLRRDMNIENRTKEIERLCRRTQS